MTAIVEAEVEGHVFLVQRIDYGNTLEVRPTYRCLVRRAAARPIIGHFYSAHAGERSRWSWGDSTFATLRELQLVESALERVIEASSAELDAELEARRAARSVVQT